MAVLNYAEVYEQALAQAFKSKLKFGALYTPSVTATSSYKFTGGKNYKIPSLTVSGFVDADRDSIGTISRNFDNAWEDKTMSHDREFTTLVDPVDIDETNMTVTIANITKVFNDEQKIPEMDKYMASSLYADLDTHGTVDTSSAISTSAEVLAVFDKFMEEMDDAEVPEEGRYLYVRPAIYTKLKNALSASRQLGTAQANDAISRTVSRLDDVEIVRVPSARMKSAYDFTTGAVAAVGAEDINMILVHPKTVVAPVKVESAMVSEPSAQTKGKFVYYERMYWDAEAITKRIDGIKIHATLNA